jgi:hypothetical protein
MRRWIFWCLALVSFVCVSLSVNANAQGLMADGKFGLSFFSGGGSSTAVLFGGAVDFPLNDQSSLFARPELNITTHGATPIEIAGVVKYDVTTSFVPHKLYVDGGLGIWFMTGGPYIGLDLGGGIIFPLQNEGFQIPLEIRLGPIFSSGASIFQIALTTGVRFPVP